MEKGISVIAGLFLSCCGYKLRSRLNCLFLKVSFVFYLILRRKDTEKICLEAEIKIAVVSTRPWVLHS